MKQYIYKFTFPNGKVYIGRTDNFERRLAEHKYKSINNPTNKLHNALNKHGWDNVIKHILCEVYSLEEAIAKEYEYIVEYNSIRNGYNLTENTSVGGDNWEGRRDTPAFKSYQNYMSKRMKGSTNGMFNKKHSEEAKQKQKEKAKGRFTLPWFIEKYGEDIGTQKYQERCQSLRERNLKLYAKM